MTRTKLIHTEPSLERKNNPYLEKEKQDVDGLMVKCDRVIDGRSRNVFESLNSNNVTPNI